MPNNASLTLGEFQGDHLSIKMFLVPRLVGVAIGDGASHPLSGYYATLAAAQADYAVATSLTNELAWCVMQTAVNYAVAHGSYLEVPYGTYLHDQTLTVGNIRIFGQTGQNIIQYTGSGTAWAFTNAGFTVDGLIIRSSRGAFSGSNPTGAQIGFDLNTCSEYFIRNCFFGGGPSLGFDQAVRCIKSGLGTFRDNTFTFCNNGINLEYGSVTNAHIVIDANQFFSMARAGVVLTNCLQVYITKNYFEAVQNGILIDNSVTGRLVGGVSVVTSCGSLFIERNTFLETAESTFPGMLAFSMLGGSTTNLLTVYNCHIHRNTVNIGTPASNYGFSLILGASPFSTLTFKARGNAIYGCATAGVHTDSANIQITLEDNRAFTTAFDSTSAAKPFIDGAGSQLGYSYDAANNFLELNAKALDLNGAGEHDVILRDTSATVDQQIVRWRKFGSNSFFEAINTAFNAITKGFLGFFSATGNVWVGDSAGHTPVDDGVNAVQIQGPAKVNGQFIAAGNTFIGTPAATPLQTAQILGSIGTTSLTHGSYATASFGVSAATELDIVHENSTGFPVVLQTRHNTVDSLSFPLCLNPLGGKVGVNTKLPGFTFSVVSGSSGDGISLRRSGTGANTAFQFQNEAGTNGAKIYTVGATDALILGAAGGTDALTILTGGNVGIGTILPTAPLQVVGLTTFASDAAAGTGGLTAGAFYKDAAGGLHVKL